MNAISFEKLTIGATAVGLDAATLRAAGAPARLAIGVLEDADVRFCYDGSTPTATSGQLLKAGEPFVLEGESNLARLRFIRTGGTSGVLPITCHDAELTPGKVLQGGVFGRAVAAAEEKALGIQADYANTTDGAQSLLGGVGYDRIVFVQVVVTEVFADGNTTQTVFTIGSGADPDLLMADTVLVDAAAGTRFTFAGLLPSGEVLTVTGTPAAGTGTGEVQVTALAARAL